jgi:hypothetical protein
VPLVVKKILNAVALNYVQYPEFTGNAMGKKLSETNL